jgi:hypothetical protein
MEYFRNMYCNIHVILQPEFCSCANNYNQTLNIGYLKHDISDKTLWINIVLIRYSSLQDVSMGVEYPEMKTASPATETEAFSYVIFFVIIRLPANYVTLYG